MSKGNMLLGYARGKVGDVVFSRLNGQQITRARNRSPKNPRTAAQMAQRAILATLGKAYSAGSFIFDHSFEGKKVGQENQSTFMARNIGHFRNILLDELNDPPVRGNGISLVGPKALYPVPGRYIVSEGSLEQEYFSFDYVEPQPGATNLRLNVSLPKPVLINELAPTVAQYLEQVGLINGDLYTFVFFCRDEVSESLEPPVRFGFVRMKVNPSIDLDEVADDIELNEIFECVGSSFVASNSDIFKGSIGAAVAQSEKTSFNIDLFLTLEMMDYRVSSVACIRSHELSGRRSNSRMMWARTEGHPKYSSRDYIEAWQAEAFSITDPTLLLEGANPNAGELV